MTTSQLVHRISNVFTTPLWQLNINEDTEPFDEEEILTGDYVRYFDEALKDYAIGQFVNLWQWSHPDETSPIWGDKRTMAYIKTATGTTYADVLHITLVDDYDDFDWFRYQWSAE